MAAKARVMVPVNILPAMVVTGTTIPEPDPDMEEVAWVSGGSYTADEDLVTYQGSVYACVKDMTGRTAPPPDEVAGYWLRRGPTNRMAPFDDYTNTKARAEGSMTFVIKPGFMNGIKLYGMEGDGYEISVKDAPGGTVIAEQEGDLYAQAAGLWELLFTTLPLIGQASVDNIELAPDPEVTITVFSNNPSGKVALGTVKIGDWRLLIGKGVWGDTKTGASVKRKSYTYREYFDDGTYAQTRRPSSRDVRCSIEVQASEAMLIDSILDEIQDVAVPFEASDLPRYGYLNTLGFVTGTLAAPTYATTSLDLEIQGNI